VVAGIIGVMVAQDNASKPALQRVNRLVLWGDAPSRPKDAEADSSLTAGETLPGSHYTINLKKVMDLAAGTQHFVALKDDGTVWAWGGNKFGQIGTGSTQEIISQPVQVKGLPSITAVSASQNHSLALDRSGHVWAWGSNLSSQLGDGKNADLRSPVQVQGIDNVKDIAAGYRFSTALKKDGTVWAWGGKCATDTDPKLAHLVEEFKEGLEKEEGYFHPESSADPNVISRLNDCVGESIVNIESRSPKQIAGVSDITELSAGFGHILALKSDGTVWGWGCNKYGQTGAGFKGNQTANRTPVKVKDLPPIRSVSAGFRHSLALDESGNVWSWGQNYHGQLGDGKTADNAQPTKIPGLPKVAHLQAAHESSFVIGQDHSIWGWGANETRQLGSDAKEQFEKAQKIGTSDRVVRLVGSQEQIAIVLDH
jgi:alpha-tubulin suppressor-like RCC1 family protein